MTSRRKHRIAAALALIVGLLSIKEGGGVLLGMTTKAYPVLPWLVWYNVVLGGVSVITGIGFWKERGWAIRYAATIVSLHGLVFVLLLVLYALTDAAALQSVLAMLFRTLLWAGIIALTKTSKQEPDNRPHDP